MKVSKRNGEIVDFDENKFSKIIPYLAKDLSGIKIEDLLEEVRIQLNDGISTSSILKLYENTASSKIDVAAPNWSFVAARVLLFDMYKQYGGHAEYPKLVEYLEKGYKANRIIKGLGDFFDLNKLDQAIDMERDKLFNYLALRTVRDKYLLKDQEGKIIELPQHMWMGVAMFLASRYANIEGYDVNDLAIEFYNVMSKLEFVPATPILSNARTVRHQLSSCYVGSTDDSIEGIFDSLKSMALLSKYGGGIGWDFNNIRSIGDSIAGHKGVSSGVIPFLKIVNDTAIAVDQLGLRKGAIACYIEPWHGDIKDFLDLRKNSGEERRRAHDLFPALWIPDLFMERILEDGEWCLFSPNQVPDLHHLYGDAFKARYEEYEKMEDKVVERLKAKDLWKIILRNYFETGLPFLCFKDIANTTNPNQHSGKIYSSNLCTEIFQNTKASNYNIFVNTVGNGTVLNKEKLPTEISVKTFGRNDVVKSSRKVTTLDKYEINGKEINILPHDKNPVERNVYTNEPQDGEIAVCNLGSINLERVNTTEDIERVCKSGVLMLDAVLDLNFTPIKDAATHISKYRSIGIGVMGEAAMTALKQIHFGSIEHRKLIHNIMEDVLYYSVKASMELAKLLGKYSNFEGSLWSKGIFPHDFWDTDRLRNNYQLTENEPLRRDWDTLKEEVKIHGMRNGYLLSIAPTSNISIVSSTTQTIEPIYKQQWMEENATGVIPAVVPNIGLETVNYYKSAYNIEQIKLVELAAIRQRFIDQGQSLNLFFNVNNVSAKDLHICYTRAWELGLKSTYYLRSMSKEVEESDVVDRSMECEGCQ